MYHVKTALKWTKWTQNHVKNRKGGYPQLFMVGIAPYYPSSTWDLSLSPCPFWGCDRKTTRWWTRVHPPANWNRETKGKANRFGSFRDRPMWLDWLPRKDVSCLLLGETRQVASANQHGFASLFSELGPCVEVLSRSLGEAGFRTPRLTIFLLPRLPAGPV